MTTTAKFNVRAVLIAPLSALIASLALAFCSGIFLFNVAFAFGGAPGADSIIFTILFRALFVLPAYVLCGYIAARMAGTRPLVHAAIAAAILLFANALMVFPLNPFALSWTDVLCYVSIVPLGLVGGFLAAKH